MGVAVLEFLVIFVGACALARLCCPLSLLLESLEHACM